MISQAVLVTGGSGFIGRRLVRRLIERQCRVWCLVRAGSQVAQLRRAGAQLTYGDVLDRDSVDRALAESQAGTVFHLAGVVRASHRDNFARVNASGVGVVAGACAAYGQPVLVVVSSLAAAGVAVAGRPRVEEEVAAPISAYGCSKLAGEQAAAGSAGGVPISIVRPPIVYGPGDRAVLEMFRPIARHGWHLMPGRCAGERQVSLIHVDDLVEGLLLVAERGERLGVPGSPGQGIYFLAGEENPTYEELGRAMATALGRKAPSMLRVPGLLLSLAGRSGDVIGRITGKALWINNDKMSEALAGSWTCSPAKARDQLGWSPAHGLKERLRETVEWYRRAGWLEASKGWANPAASAPPSGNAARAVQRTPAMVEHSSAMDAGSIARLEALAYQWGQSYDSYLVMDLDRNYFWCSGGRGVLGFVLRKRQAVVIGGLIGPDDAREELLTEFMEHCRRNKWTACFGLVAEHDLQLFDRHGFQSTKIGEDALIGLCGTLWKGKAFEWVRRQTNFCQRQKLVCREIGTATANTGRADEHMAELGAISRRFLDATPHGRMMRYFVGRFDPELFSRRRVFAAIAGGGEGRVEGFVVCTPYRNGAAWGIEMYRSRADAVRGTVPFLIQQVMQVLADEGVKEASLCLMPAARCAQRRAGDSWLIHAYIRLTHRYFNFILDTPGLFHFKTRFRPRCENRYCSIWPRASVRPFHAILSTWGTLQFSPWKALIRGLRRLRIRRQRATLMAS